MAPRLSNPRQMPVSWKKPQVRATPTDAEVLGALVATREAIARPGSWIA
jgi:hypothetical protein